MKLYLLRHATAHDVATCDEARALTQEGEEEARIVGAALVKLGVEPADIFTSPILRARQTASIAATVLKPLKTTITSLDELVNGATPADLLHAVKRHTKSPEVLLVGHMPSLADHLGALIGATHTENLSFGKASVACVQCTEWRLGRGQLRWFMRQKQLRAVAKSGKLS